MINTYLLSAFAKDFTQETFLFLKYYSFYEQIYQKARLSNRKLSFDEMPESAKNPLLPSLRSCSARLFEMNRICIGNFGVSFIIGFKEQEAYFPSELHDLVNEAVKSLTSSTRQEHLYA